jgi:hypothetical protein
MRTRYGCRSCRRLNGSCVIYRSAVVGPSAASTAASFGDERSGYAAYPRGQRPPTGNGPPFAIHVEQLGSLVTDRIVSRCQRRADQVGKGFIRDALGVLDVEERLHALERFEHENVNRLNRAIVIWVDQVPQELIRGDVCVAEVVHHLAAGSGEVRRPSYLTVWRIARFGGCHTYPCTHGWRREGR